MEKLWESYGKSKKNILLHKVFHSPMKKIYETPKESGTQLGGRQPYGIQPKTWLEDRGLPLNNVVQHFLLNWINCQTFRGNISADGIVIIQCIPGMEKL